MPKISVIMPSLNVAPYYKKCMNSVLKQTLYDIEIIAVDAGSDDGTLDIINMYAELDSRVKVIKSSKRSYGAQMNLGLRLATGEYIAFLETDDFMSPYAMERLYDLAREDDLDYVKGCTYSFNDESYGSCRVWRDDRISLCLPNGEEIISPHEYPNLLTMDFHVWNGLYKRSFLSNIRFNETNGASFQDIGFIIQYIIKANRARYIDLPVYWYRRSNVASSVYNQSGFMYLADEYERIVKIAVDMNEVQWKFIWKRLLVQIITRCETMYKSGNVWPSFDKDMQRLYYLLKKAERNNQLDKSDENDVYGQLLRLILAGEFDVLKSSAWLTEPARYFIDAFQKGSVLIYGAGKRGLMLMESALRMRMWPPVAFVDSNPERWGKSVSGIKIVSLKEARDKYPQNTYMVAAKGHEQEIKEKLIAAGVDNKHIMCFDIGSGLWHSYMERMQMYAYK